MSLDKQDSSVVGFWWKNSSRKHRLAGVAFMLTSLLYAYVSYSATLFFVGGTDTSSLYLIALSVIILIQGLPNRMADAVKSHPKADMGIRFVVVFAMMFFMLTGSMIALVQNFAFS